MRNHRLYSSMAREDNEANAVTPEQEAAAAAAAPEVPLVEGGAESLEADQVAIADDLTAVQADETTVDNAVEVAEEMEIAVESLRIAAANGGLDRNGAQMFANQKAAWAKRLDAPKSQGQLSIESFGATGGRAGQTTLTHEEEEKNLRSLYDTIAAFLKSLMDKVVALWNRLFDGATKLKERADKLKAGKFDGEPAAKTFNNPTLAKALHIAGKVDVVNDLTVLNALAEAVQPLVNTMMTFGDAIGKAIEAGNAEEVAEMTALMKMPGSSETKVTDPAQIGLSNPGEGLEMFKGMELPGNKTMVAIRATQANAKLAGKVGYRLGTFDTSKKVDEKLEMPVLAPADISKVAETISKLAGHVLSFKATQSKVEGETKKILASAQKKAKASADANTGNAGVDVDSVRGVLRSITTLGPVLTNYLVSAGGAAIQYAEQSAKQYGGKAAAPAAAPAAGAPAGEAAKA